MPSPISSVSTSSTPAGASRSESTRRLPIPTWLLLLAALLALLSAAPAAAQPSLVEIEPAHGAVVTDAEVTIEGRVSSAGSLLIDGQRVGLEEDGSFRHGPISLPEGQRTWVIALEDGAGAKHQEIYHLTRDSRPPALTISHPRGRYLRSHKVAVRGTAADPHLEAVSVDGELASLRGNSFEAVLALGEGEHDVDVVARDRFGHESRRRLQLVVDSRAPRVLMRAGGQQLADGLVARRLLPEIEAESEAHIEVRIDGRPWSGAPIEREGSYELAVTVTDAAGNVTTERRRFTIDRTPPEIGTVDGTGEILPAGPAMLRGHARGAVAVTVDGRAARLDGDRFEAGPFALRGERSFRIVATDEAGNSSIRRAVLKNDPDAPDLTITSPADGSVLGASPATVAGTAVDVDLASVTVNSQAATLDGSSWSASVLLVEGANTLTVIATDTAGNSSQSSLAVTLDTAAPALSLTAAGAPLLDGAVFAGSVTPEATATDATAVTLDATLDSAPYVPGTTVTELGSHQLSVTATDAAGNSTTVVRTFTVEGQPPVFVLLSPQDGTLTSAADVILTVRLQGAASLTLDGQPVTLVGQDFVSAPQALVEGDRTFVLVATSAGGQTTQATVTVTRDSAAPTLSIDAPADGALQAAAQLTVSGTVADAHLQAVTVNGAAAQVAGGAYSAQIHLAEGENTLRVRAVDGAGNNTTIERTAMLDSRPPVLAVTEPQPGTEVPEASYEIRGSASDPHLDRVEVGGAAATLSGGGLSHSFSHTVTLALGENIFTVEAFDTLGHSATDTVSIRRVPDAPSVRITQPAEHAVTAAATIDVSGTVEAGATVTLNGADTTVSGGTWSITGVALSPGENVLTARATDSDGHQGKHVRLVTRDVEAPQLVSAQPAGGSPSIAPGTVFRLTFSEPLAEPGAGDLRLETAAASPIAHSARFAADAGGDVLLVEPDADLPPATAIELVLTSGLEDLAGRGLTATTLSFTTSGGSAPGAPVVTPAPPAYLCASSLELAGTATPLATLTITGGASAVQTQADASGAWSASVLLEAERLNRLALSSGQASSFVEVVHDCTPPAVASASRAGDVVTIVFDEPVDGATLAPSITVSDASGAVAGTTGLGADGATATFTAGTTLGDPVQLTVDQAVSDLAGNKLAFPFSQVWSASGADSFFSGTVVDDATSQPLEGVRVVVTATGGVAVAEPAPEQTTGADGRFLLAIAPGTHDVTLARPGYTPAFRIVTTTSGAGTDVFNPRLAPASAASTIDAAGGTVTDGTASDGTVELTIPAAALAAATPVAVTGLSEQGLPALLPYGYSPRGAAWVDVGEALAAGATLELPVESPDGTLLIAAELDLDTLQWRSLGHVSVAGGRVQMSVPGLGAYAALEADTGTTAPPAAIAGEVLGSSAAPAGDEVLAVAIDFDPAVVLPTQTSRATAIYTLAVPAPSGLPVTMLLREELELLDGSLRRAAPSRADLVIYRSPAGDMRSRFELRPSEAARLEPIRLGAEDVELFPYLTETVRGNVLGPDGGSVLGEAGDRLTLPAGAVSEPTAIVLTRLAEADLPLAAPRGATIDGVIDVDLGGGGTELALPATLSLNLGVAGTGEGVLLHVIELEGEPLYRVVAELESSAGGWTSKAIDGADLAWPGLTTGGTYVFARFAVPHAFARGTVIGIDGLPLAGAVVSSPQVDWIQLTHPDGRYALPMPLGDGQLDIADPTTGNQVSESITLTTAGERVDSDAQVEVIGPRVVQTTPADGAVVPAGLSPTVRFSELIDASSVATGIRLFQGEDEIELAFDVQGALVTVQPRSSLAPGEAYELRIGIGVRDLQGYGLELPVIVRFETQDVALPSGIDLDKVFVIEPDAGGFAQVVGDAGSVGSGDLVWVENLSAYVTTPSVLSSQDGSFSLQIEASLGDRLLLHILVPGGNEIAKLIGPFVSADRRTGWITGEREVRFRTGDGVTLYFPEGSFDRLTPVTVAPRSLDSPPIPWPGGVMTPVFSFDVDFPGELLKPADLRVPAPAGAQPGWYLMAKPYELFGQDLWSLKEILALDGDELTSEPGVPASQPASVVVGQDKAATPPGAEKASDPNDPREYSIGLVNSSHYSVFSVEDEEVGFMTVLVDSYSVFFNDQFPYLAVEISDALGFLTGAFRAAIPKLLGQDFTLSATDSRTGFERLRQLVPASQEEVTHLPSVSYDDITRTVPASGSPLRFHLLSAHPGRIDIAEEIYAEVTDQVNEEGALEATQTMTLTFEQESLLIDESDEPRQVRIYDLVDGSVTTTSIGPEIRTGQQTMTRQVQVGHAYVVTIASIVRGEEWIEIEWTEALDQELEGFELYLGSEKVADLKVEPLGHYERVRLRPENGWLAGKEYKLRLTDKILDASKRSWLDEVEEVGCQGGSGACEPDYLDVTFKIRQSSLIGDGLEIDRVSDIEHLGGLLLAAEGLRGFGVYDASNPAKPKNYFGNDFKIHFPLQDQVLAVEVDSLGRIFATGGGLLGRGHIFGYDPQKFDELKEAVESGSVPVINDAQKKATAGASVISSGPGSLLAGFPEGRPGDLEILNFDLSEDWRLGVEDPPDGLSLSPDLPENSFDTFTVTFTGNDAEQGQSLILRNHSRGTWKRVEANDSGQFEIELEARWGESVELVRSADALGYVAVHGAGVAVVDLNHFWDEFKDDDGDGEPDDPPKAQSEVLRFTREIEIDDSEYDGQLCDPNEAYVDYDPLELELLGKGSGEGPYHLVSLLDLYGFSIHRIDRNNPVELEKTSVFCGVWDGSSPVSGRMTGMAVVEDYRVKVRYDDPDDLRFDDDGNPIEEGFEERDYVALTQGLNWLLLADITDPTDPRLVARIKMPTAAKGVTADVANGQLIVSAGEEGMYVVDFQGPYGMKEIDINTYETPDLDADGKDDRVVQHIEIKDEQTQIALDVNRPVHLWPDLGVTWVGGLRDPVDPQWIGLGPVAFTAPLFRFVAQDDRGPFVVSKVAPFGVPVEERNDPDAAPPEPDEEEKHYPPGLIRVEATLWNELATEDNETGRGRYFEVDLVSVGPGEIEIDGLGDPDRITKLPPTSLRKADDKALRLWQQSDEPWQEGYLLFLSDPVVTLADARASHWYKMTDLEEELSDPDQQRRYLPRPLCDRCDLEEEDVYPPGGVIPAKAFQELLSGHAIEVQMPEALRGHLETIYGDFLAGEAGASVPSVPWGLSPSVRQEPVKSPSLGHGQVAAGTLLHSGEYTNSALDLSVPGVGFDLAPMRYYRSQTVSNGPLGPGWFLKDRMWLRELPNGDLDFFDGTGRRETFRARGETLPYEPPPGRFVSARKFSDGFRLFDNSGMLYRFDLHGRLTKIQDPFKTAHDRGSEINFSYDQASRLVGMETCGRTMRFIYDTKGRLKELKDDTDRVVKYHYDADGRLERVESTPVRLSLNAVQQTLSTRFEYEAQGSGLARVLNRRDNIKKVIDAKNQAILEITWAPGPGNQGWWIERQSFGNATKYGSVGIAYSDANGLVTTTVTDALSRIHKYEHTEEGHPEKYLDPGQFTTEWKYDAFPDVEHGLVTETTLPSGRKTEVTYIHGGQPARPVPGPSLGNVASVIERPALLGDPIGMTTGCTTIPRTNGSGTSITWSYSNFHHFTQKPRRIVTPQGFELDLTLDQNRGFEDERRGTTSGGTDGPVIGELKVDVRDKLGRVEKLMRERREGPASIDPAHHKTITTDLTYLDPKEMCTRLVTSETVTVSGGGGQTSLVTHYKPHLRGYVEEVTEPGNVKHEFEYNDLGWLLEECRDTTGLNLCQRYEYDELGQLTEVHKPYGQTAGQTVRSIYAYGRQGELDSEEHEVTPGGTRVSTTYTYDRLIRPERIQQTGRSPIDMTYNQRGFLESRQQVVGQNTLRAEFDYGDDGQVTEVRIGQGQQRVYRTLYDGYRRPMYSVDPLDHHQLTIYDAGGQPKTFQSCDASGDLLSWTNTTFDGAGQLVREAQISFSKQVIPGQGGNPPVTTFPPTGSVSATYYLYSSEGDLVKIVDPRQQITQWKNDALDRLHSITVQGGLEFHSEVISYDPRGNPLTVREFVGNVGQNPNSFTTTYDYDGLNRLLSASDGFSNTTNFAYDRASNLIRVTVPGGHVTNFSYDGLGRNTGAQGPAGVNHQLTIVDAVAGGPNSQTTYADSTNQQTVSLFDGAGRLERVTFADGKTERYTYNAHGELDTVVSDAGNPGQLGQTTETHHYYGNGWLRERQLALAPGLGGHTVETFNYNGAGLPTSMSVGATTTTYTYDSLLRLDSTTQGNHTVGFGYDLASNPEFINYSSGIDAMRHHGALGQLMKVHMPSAVPFQADADYQWLGGSRVAEKIVSTAGGGQSGSFTGQMTHDVAGRLAFTRKGSTQQQWLGEDVKRNARDLVTGLIRTDRNNAGWQLDYDAANRLNWGRWTGFDNQGAPDGRQQWRTSRPHFESFQYDVNDNLVHREEDLVCEDRDIPLPIDGSGRNRLGNINGKLVEWSERGNMVRKDDFRFVYNARDELIEVYQDTGSGFTLHSTNTYDVEGRRILHSFGGRTWRTVWAGMYPIEEYELQPDESEVLVSRRLFGATTDEMVSYEFRLSSEAELTRYTPVYDAIGNIALMLGPDGKPVERYEYSLYGERKIWTDSTPPELEQVRLASGEIWVEFSEEIRRNVIEATLNSTLLLKNIDTGADIPLTLDMPVQNGRQARHSIRLRLDVPPADLPEDQANLQLIVPAGGLEDLFGNRQTTAPGAVNFTWSAAPGITVADDRANPELIEACIKGGKLHLVFSEPPKADNFASQLQLDGASASWTVLADGYTVELDNALSGGSHTIGLLTGPFDLAGKALQSAPPTLSITGAQDQEVWTSGFPGEIAVLPGWRTPLSTIGNRFGFKGLQVDEGTGLVYMRARFYDPETGRFLQRDPLGFADSSNPYQFALNDPINNSDPTGLYVESGWDALSLGIGIWSFRRNVREGNFGDAVIDAIGIVVDTAALLAPVPGGVGAARNTGRIMDFARGYEAARDTNRFARTVRTMQTVDQAVNIGQGAILSATAMRDGNVLTGMGYGVMSALGLRQLGRPFDPPCPRRRTCFAAGTEIATSEGEVPIEEIEVGDQVWAYNEETGEEEPAKVLNLFTRTVDKIYQLHVGDEVIETTAEHPFLVVGEGWTEAADLEADDPLHRLGRETLTLDRVEIVEGTVQVFNFEVEGLHNYFVSTEQVLVHNCPVIEFDPLVNRYRDLNTGRFVSRQAAARYSSTPQTEADYFRRIQFLEKRYGTNTVNSSVHSLERHGAQTTPLSQFRRVSEPLYPNPTTGLPGNATKNASRFLTHRDHYLTLRQAILEHKMSGGTLTQVHVQFQRYIGTTFRNLGTHSNRGPFSVTLSGRAIVRFNAASGKFYTAYPVP